MRETLETLKIIYQIFAYAGAIVLLLFTIGHYDEQALFKSLYYSWVLVAYLLMLVWFMWGFVRAVRKVWLDYRVFGRHESNETP